MTLARGDFVEPEAPDIFGDEAWGFRHALVCDEAYAGIPKRRRGALHREIAAIVADRAGRRGVEADELIGYHLESAHRAQAEVDPQAPELSRLAADAARHLAAAAAAPTRSATRRRVRDSCAVPPRCARPTRRNASSSPPS